MPYKDKEKQREAVKQATRRYRASKGAGMGITTEPNSVTPVIPSVTPAVIPKARQAALNHLRNYPAFEGPVIEPEPQSYNSMMVGYVPPVLTKD